MGCDQAKRIAYGTDEISIHAPTWGATLPRFLPHPWQKFQSTHPRGVRPRLLITDVATTPISIHAPTWGATDLIKKSLRYLEISIHAPTWGATSKMIFVTLTFNISIHAPTWGATSMVTLPKTSMTFQSTHPRGVRLKSQEFIFLNSSISIHAPTWGATVYLVLALA